VIDVANMYQFGAYTECFGIGPFVFEQYPLRRLTGIWSTAWRKTGSTFVYTLFVRPGEECSNSFWVTALNITQKNYMIDALHFIRLLNPISHRNFQEISVFSQKIDIYSDSI